MRKELHMFANSLSGDFPITEFPGGSLCAFNDGFLYVLKHFSLIGGKVEYSQHLKIVPVPAIPSVIKVKNLKVSDDGSRVILLAEDAVYVILIELEVLKILSKKSSCVEVFCESQNISPKYAKYGKIKVVDSKFIPDHLYAGSHLSILTSDNVIRLYSLISDLGAPVLDIDLNCLLQNSNPNDVSYLNDNTFGLYSNIVCYELITCVPQLCFLICDSDGQLHTATVTDELSPFLSSLEISLNYPCEFFAFHNIKHPLEQAFSAYAAITCEDSEDLTHFIVIPSAGSFEVHFHEKVQLNSTISQAYFMEFGEYCYCIGTPKHLYLIDCRNWINYYSEITLSASVTNSNTDSQLHVVALCNQKEPIENIPHTAGQLVSLRCSTENGELTMLLIQFPSSALFPSFIKNKITTQTRLSEASEPSKINEDWKTTEIDPLVEQMRVLPKLTGFTKEDSKKIFKELELWLASLSYNLARLKAASSNAVKRLSEISTVAKRLMESKNELISRLAVVSADMINFHEQANHRRHRIDVLANRIDSLTRRASEKRPLTTQEKQMLKTLKDYKKKAVSLSDRAAHMHIEVAEAKRNAFGPAKSFQPSTASYLSSIEKSSREIDAIVSRITKITQTIDAMQLFYDGHQQLALSLSQAIGCSSQPPPPSDKLFRLVSIAKQFVDDPDRDDKETSIQFEALSSGLDLEFDADIIPTSPEPSMYETIYLTAHKAPCRAAAFNTDGTLVATGSADCSIKIMDVERMVQKEGRGEQTEGPDSQHPVIRTLYDHIDEVTTIAFHPREQILVSGSNDKTLKLFDYSKTAVKRAMKTINEVYPLRAMSFHPGGEYLLVTTEHSTLRLYNVETAQCFVGSNPADQHKQTVLDVNWSDNARLFVTGSKDGDVRVWDGISNRCVETFTRAHDGAAICSARFTRNGKYILTSGLDSIVKLWELSTNRCLIAYTGAGATGGQDYPAQAAFNHNEDYVLFPDEKSGSLCSWDARNSDRKRLLALGHTSAVRAFVHSPTMPAFLSCSDDFRARFWYKKNSI